MSLPAPLNKKFYKLAKAHGYIKLKGTGRFTKAYQRIGDYTNINQQNEFESEPIFGSDSPTRTKRDDWLVQKSGTINVGIRNMTPLAHSLIFLTDPNAFYLQAAIPDDTEFLTDALQPTEAVILPFINGIVTGVFSLDAIPIEYFEGQHYVFDSVSGLFEIVKHPAGVVVDTDGAAAVAISHGAPAITAADKKGYGGNMQLDNGHEASLVFVQIGKGPNLRLTYPAVTFLNSEEIPIANDENTPVAISLTGSLAEDPNEGEGFRWGSVLELSERVAA